MTLPSRRELRRLGELLDWLKDLDDAAYASLRTMLRDGPPRAIPRQPTARLPAPPKQPAADPNVIARALADTDTREAAQRLLASLNKPQLEALARTLGVPPTGTKPILADRIVNATVGTRLGRDAIHAR